MTAVGVAYYFQDNSLGLLNFLNMPSLISIIFSIMILDLTIYWQHVFFHKFPLLWRLHRMHHSDLDFDVSTGARFHPIEIILSMLIKITVIILLGAPPLAVLIFEILLNAMAMFNHGNIFLPPKLDALLKIFVVTPDMHRIHHSIRIDETNSNFGFNIALWDRIFGTYISYSKDGQEGIIIGINQLRSPKYLKLHWLLIQPFLKIKK